MPNADTEGRDIIELIHAYQSDNPGRVAVYTSLGQVKYLSAIKHCDLVIGNSSRGLYEVPLFRKPTVNIGERQRGRLQSDTIINCKEENDDIVNAINQALSTEFQEKLANANIIYNSDGKVSSKIKDVLKNTDLKDILMKKFFDLVVKL